MDENALVAAYVQRRPLLSELARILDESTRDAVEGIPHIDRISYRVKEQDSFLKKASQYDKYRLPLVEIEDQVAGRVITFFKDDIPIVHAALVSRFGAVEYTIKEPAGPQEFGYESEHFVFVIPQHLKPSGWDGIDEMPTTFELQLRTLFMHAWAEPQHDLGYKGGETDWLTRRELAWVAASAWGADRTLNDVAQRLSASPNC